MNRHARHRVQRGRHRKPESAPPFLKAGLTVAMVFTLWTAFTSERSTWATPVAAVPDTGIVLATETPPAVVAYAPPTTSPTATTTTAPTTTATSIATTTRATVPTTTSRVTTPPLTTTPRPPTAEAPPPEPEAFTREVDLISAARSFLDDGIPYVWGGKTRAGLDCSGFIWNVLKNAGYDVPYRNSTALRIWTIPVSANNAQAGDLVFWPGHVGLYLGGDRLIDMSSSTGTVTERSVWSGASFGRIP